jgi:hypothetical protein
MYPTRIISFCTTCKDRRWQLEKTLPGNLERISSNMEIIVVDYGSTDGMSEWIWDCFSHEISTGKLTLFEVKGDVSWSSPKAKNLSHRLAQGSYLVNLDADNYLLEEDLHHFINASQRKIPCHQWSGTWRDGSYGRIGLSRELFDDIGGYDEGLLPMSGQDLDLLTRIKALGFDFFQAPPPAKSAVQNTIEEKVANVSGFNGNKEKTWETIVDLNLKIIAAKIQIEGSKRKGGYATYKGLLNGCAVLIDGHNNIYKLISNK